MPESFRCPQLVEKKYQWWLAGPKQLNHLLDKGFHGSGLQDLNRQVSGPDTYNLGGIVQGTHSRDDDNGVFGDPRWIWARKPNPPGSG